MYGVLRKSEGYTERAIFVIDGEGIVRYIDVHPIDEQPDNDQLLNMLRQIESNGSEPQSAATFIDVEDTLPTGGIILYCAQWCKDCRKAREWLDTHGLEYTEVDIDYNQAARDEARRLSGGPLITPTFDFNGTVVLDYNEAQLERALRTYKK